jgi:hypothetical protein
MHKLIHASRSGASGKNLLPVYVMSSLAAAGVLVASLKADTDRPGQPGDTFVGHAFDVRKGKQIFKVYGVTVTDETLKKSPSWKDDVDEPPLPARTAMKLAGEAKNALVKDTDQWAWKLESLGLRRRIPRSGPEKWYWLARYETQLLYGGLGGMPFDLYVVVLMDGTVLNPIALKKDPTGLWFGAMMEEESRK